MQCIFFFFFPLLHLFTFSNWSPTSSTSHAIRENETSCAYIQTSCQVDRVTHQKSYVRKKKTTDVLFLTNNCTVEKRKRKKNKRNKKSVSGEGYQRNSEKKKSYQIVNLQWSTEAILRGRKYSIFLRQKLIKICL